MERLPLEHKVANILPQRLMPLARGIKRTILHPSEQKEELTDPYRDVHRILEEDSPVIVDGGAKVGKMTKKFIELFENPTVHAIEPVPQHIKELESDFRNHASVRIHEVALGASDKYIDFNVNKKTGTSSVLQTSAQDMKYTENIQDRDPSMKKAINKTTVKQTRLDSIIDYCDIIKLDIQGYELEALRGAEDILSDSKAVISEVSCVPMLDGGVLFTELSNFLYERNFHLYNTYLDRAPSGQLRHGDALFLKESVYSNSEFEIDWFNK